MNKQKLKIFSHESLTFQDIPYGICIFLNVLKFYCNTALCIKFSPDESTGKYLM